MISMMAFCHDIKELARIKQASKENAAIVGCQKWMMDFYNRIDDMLEKIKENPIMDVVCFDLEQDQGISYAKYIRKCYEKAFMILMAGSDMSPMEYIRPDILPAGLIISPATDDDIKKVFREVFEALIEQVRAREDDKLYVVATREGIVRIPYRRIVYFESRNKKIYIRYDNREVGFYSTMDKIESELECYFVRTHRSFMVNKEYIRRINLSQNIVTLKNDITVPLSRSYKPSFKGMNCDG